MLSSFGPLEAIVIAAVLAMATGVVIVILMNIPKFFVWCMERILILLHDTRLWVRHFGRSV